MPTAPGSRLCSGTVQLSMYTEPVLDARNDALPGMTVVVSPVVSRSTTKPRTRPSSHRAHTTNTSATGAFVIHVLAPFSTYALLSAWYRARLSIEPMSLPAFGSVRQKLPTRSAVANRGKYCSRCSSVPYSLIACITSDDCTLSADLQNNEKRKKCLTWSRLRQGSVYAFVFRVLPPPFPQRPIRVEIFFLQADSTRYSGFKCTIISIPSHPQSRDELPFSYRKNRLLFYLHCAGTCRHCRPVPPLWRSDRSPLATL